MTSPPDHDHDDDDQAWLDLLAGRAADEALAHTRVEAAWLRAALLAWRADPPPGPPPEPADRMVRLLARARAAGLLAPTPADPAPTVRGPTGWRGRPVRGWPLGAATVALGLVVAIALPLWSPPNGPADAPPYAPPGAPPDVERGAALQTLQGIDPMRQRDALAATLRDAGLTATPYQRLGRPGLDIDWPGASSEAQRLVLRQAGLVPPDGPSLRVEFIGSGDRP